MTADLTAAVVLCIYCRTGRHDQCVSHRTGFAFCLCPASADAVEPMTLARARAAGVK